MSSLRQILLLGIAALPLAACGADDVASPGEGVIVVPGNGNGGTPPPPPGPGPGEPAASCPTGTINGGVIANRRNCQLPARISSNLTLPNLAGTVYSFSGRVDVGADVGGNGQAAGGNAVSLTVDPGVVVFAVEQSSFLVVNRGSRLNAVGTRAQPIIFTSDENILGQANDDSSNQWGGILLLGRAPISNCLDANVAGGSANCQQAAEGPGANAFYGGDQVADSSGNIQYVQIRYTGYSVEVGKELQGLTTAGVGSGTTINYVQSHNSGDDGIEVFGGRNNMKHLVLTGADDDTLDTDFGYKGSIQYVIGIQRAGGSTGDAMIEADSNDAPVPDFDLLPRQNTLLANFTFLHRRTSSSVKAINARGGPDYSLLNGIVIGTNYCLDIDNAETVRPASSTLDEAGPVVIRSVAFACPTFADPDSDTFEQQTVDAAGNTNNNFNYTPTLNLVIPGANETAFPNPVTNLVSISSFFDNAPYIGAVRDANDTWYQDWTCKSAYANFAGNGAQCSASPVA